MTRDTPLKDPPDRLISRRELRRLLPVSDMTIWRWEKAEQFPKHVTIGSRNFWRMSEVSDFIDKHTAERLRRAVDDEG